MTSAPQDLTKHTFGAPFPRPTKYQYIINLVIPVCEIFNSENTAELYIKDIQPSQLGFPCLGKFAYSGGYTWQQRWNRALPLSLGGGLKNWYDLLPGISGYHVNCDAIIQGEKMIPQSTSFLEIETELKRRRQTSILRMSKSDDKSFRSWCVGLPLPLRYST